MNVVAIPRRIGIVGGALILLAMLIGCGGPGMPAHVVSAVTDSDKPPDARITYGDVSQQGALGSYCWGNACADEAGAPVPNGTIQVSSGDVIAFRFGGNEAIREAHVRAFPLEGAKLVPAGKIQVMVGNGESDQAPKDLAVSIDAEEAMITADLPPGEYVMEVSLYMAPNQHGIDASYGFHVLIGPPVGS